MRPSELVRAMNATGLGRVTNERQLYRHRQRACGAIDRDRKVDLLAYAGWLTVQHCPEREESSPAGSLNASIILNQLKRQQYRCALTGRSLTPEIATLDHIVPVSREGRHEPGNIQILDKQVNRAKGTLTNDEFIQLCREVVAHAGLMPSITQENHP